MSHATGCADARTSAVPCSRCDVLLGLDGVRVESAVRGPATMRVTVSTPWQLRSKDSGRLVSPDLVGALGRALSGDTRAIAEISTADHGSLLVAGETIGAPLVVRRAAVVSVLRGLVDGRVPPSAAQAWASLMRRGYVAGTASGPILPIEIEFEDAWEDAISVAVSRLDEIGDLIDGEVGTGDALDLLRRLGES